MRILMSGAGGALGRATVPALVKAGHEVRALGRGPREGGDSRWFPGERVKDAVRGCDAVLLLPERRADPAAARALVAAACGAGVPHLLRVAAPATGRERRRREDAERVVRSSGLGWTLVRHSHLHQSLDLLLRQWAASPVLPVDPSLPWQPVDAREVAGYLTGLLAGEPRRAALAYGGPEVLSTSELVRTWLRARGLRRLCPRVRYPGKAAAEQRAGWLMVRNAPLGTLGWREWLTPAAELSDDFAEEHTASPTSPANQPERDPDVRVYGGDEGYQRQTRA
ncbi:SDR family oxidoreductase [Nonomuraea ferruginea]|uniref:SDR family oxidoreductase n=1 Tax=Nonomuraea ferruginea TaxID=46174 RepID=A0ABT4T3L6_9ACTN|nr:SDR family oxidoreductase [Nonomuraea ferruginea]MDA0644082.1 SDR family oxidoreductase [Nonomuraea ferruginea]